MQEIIVGVCPCNLDGLLSMEDNEELLAEVLTMPLKSLNRERVCLINNIDIDVSFKIIIHNILLLL